MPLLLFPTATIGSGLMIGTFLKAMFQFLMTLFSFTERGESEQMAPVITVPTN